MNDPERGRPTGGAGESRIAPFAAVVMVMVLFLTSCGESPPTADAQVRMRRASTSGTDPIAGVLAVDGLAADLYKRVAAKPGNFLFSPYSVEVALAMTRNGAKGDTRSQMDVVLHAGPGKDLDKALNVLDQALAKRPGHQGNAQRNGDIELSMANAMFGQRNTRFDPAFLATLATYYGAGMRLVDYRRAAEPARQEINRWAAERTHGKIIDLLPKDSLDDLTRLVLTNAIYLKAPWARKFSRLGDKPFTTITARVSAPAMYTSHAGHYRAGQGWKSAEIPYLGNHLSMVVIVPDDLARFEATLNGTTLGSLVNGPSEPLATLQMPKFSFRSMVRLKDTLSALGMPLAFTDDADFSGLTKDDPLKIKDVFHQAFIAVDEEGTEAAAATAVAAEATSASAGKSLVVDKPFLFAIRDVPTGAVLFLGRVTDPTAH